MKQQRRKRTYPTEPVHARVESLTHDGRGIARVEGRPVFIHGALPGEAIDFIYTDRRRDYAEGRLVTVHTAATERVEPRCPSFGVCGGCSFQHVADSAQIRLKQELLAEQFRRIGGLDEVPLAPPLTGPCWGYRDKARRGRATARTLDTDCRTECPRSFATDRGSYGRTPRRAGLQDTGGFDGGR